MKTQFLEKVSTSLSKVSFKLKKASPELLIVGGAIGVIGAAVGACCATRKLDRVIEEHKADVDKIHEYEENEDYPEYTHKDAQHDLTVTYARTVWKIVKLYGPSVLLGTASLGCMMASNQILRRRNAALAAAYTAVDSAFKRYRKNVVDRFGEMVDKEMYFGTKAEKIETKETDDNGKEKKVKKTVNVEYNPPGMSEYARCFDQLNPNYKSNSYLNQTFINGVYKWAVSTLNAQGYLFLNEVYEHLGFPASRAGQIVGWLKHGDGDGYIDKGFGMFDTTKEINNAFQMGYEPAVWLDFNVDGPILDYMHD